MWRDSNGELKQFSIRQVWSDYKFNYLEVSWKKLVWFSQCIPSHSFVLWMAIHERLQTQDRVFQWNNDASMRCFLCKQTMDSHDHLFVQCTYAEEVWKNVRVIGYLSQLKHNWDDTISAMSANHYNAIKSVVTRLKSLRVKNSANVQKVANEWGIIFNLRGSWDNENHSYLALGGSWTRLMKYERSMSGRCTIRKVNPLMKRSRWTMYVSLLHCHRRMDGSKEGGCSLSSDASPFGLKVVCGSHVMGNIVKDVSTASPNEGIVTNSPTDSNESGPSLTGPTSYAKLYTGEPCRKSVNFRTLLTPAGNGADANISLESVRAVSERFANTVYGFFLGKRVAYADGMDAMLENGPWFTRNTSFILNKWNPDVNLSKEDVGNVSIWVKFHGVPMTAFSKCRLSAIATKLGWSEYGIKPTKQVYRLVSNKKSASTSGTIKQVKLSRQEGSLAVAPGSSSTTPIAERIDKLEKQILDGNLMFVDDNGKPIYKADSMVNADSDIEVEEVFNEPVVDDDYDPYNDNPYDDDDMSDNLQAICDDLDIKVRSQKKK
ncbi:zinc finger, CCHC-type containing protein [Tanacetum coccineum]|uniref:Zinc finger, CCHC-type containing protein n=1 Tax=Tanacetum coccineum TaxID=301880 RepID=A0ABQ5IWA7_9ASTR